MDFKKAGDLFCEIRDFQSALKMYWTGKHYQKISLMARKYPDIQQSMEYRFINIRDKLKDEKKNFSLLVRIFIDFADYLDDPSVEKNVYKTMHSWSQIIEELLDIPIKSSSTTKPDIDWQTLCGACARLAEKGYINIEKLALVYFHGNRYEKAIEAWENAEQQNHKLYRHAKAELLLKSLKEDNSFVLDQKKDQELLNQYFQEQGDYIQAARYAAMYGGIGDIEKNFIYAYRNKKESVSDIAIMLISIYIKYEKWKKLMAYLDRECFDFEKDQIILEKQTDGRKQADKAKELSTETWKPTIDECWQLRAELIKKLANSEKVSKSGLKVIQKISEIVLGWSSEHECWNYFHPIIVGTVLERTALDKDCLRFYENIFKKKLFSENIIIAAKKRWLVCKLRQIERLKKRFHAPKIGSYQRELNRKKAEWAIPYPENEPEFSDISILDSLNKSESTDDIPVTAKIGNIIITYDQIKGRMRVQRGEFDSISIHALKKTCVSVDVSIERIGDIYNVSAWNFQCDFTGTKKTGKFSIRVDDEYRDFYVKPVADS